MSAGQTSAAETAIQAGRQHYTAKRYKPALEQFTRVRSMLSRARMPSDLSLGYEALPLR